MSSSNALLADDLRAQLIKEPDVILDDPDLMRALVAANEGSLAGNIVDLRGIAMERLEARLDRLEDTHRTVIAAAYENLAGTNQVHRAILKMLDPHEFEDFLHNLDGEVAEILRIDSIKLILETRVEDGTGGLERLGHVLSVAEPGFVDDYITQGRNVPIRPVTLRQLSEDAGSLHGETGDWIRSEACLRLDFGAGRLPGMLVMGAEDPHQFKPSQGTDLLAFFGGIFERAMRRWLS